MRTTTDVLNVKLTADDSGFSAKMRSASKQAEDFGKASQEAAAKASAGFKDLKSALVGLGIGQTIKTSITDAMNAVKSESLFETSLGGLSKQARAWSDELSSSLGLDGYALRKNLGMLYNMTTSMGLAKDASFDLSTGVVQLAEDMASFYNLSSDEAFNKLKSGLTGEVEPLKALGILVDENTVKQYAYATGIAKAGDELTQQEKVLARYQAILGQTANAQGYLARTIDSPSNQMRIMMNDLKMASIEFGTALMPIVKTALPIFRDVIADAAPIAVDMAKGVSLLSSGLGMLESPSIRAIAYTVAIAGAMNKLKLAVGGPLSAILLLGSALTWLVGKFGETEQSTAEVIDTTMTDAAAETDKVGKSADEMGEKYKRAGDMVKSMLAPFDDVNKLSGSGSTLGSSLVSQEDVENATALSEELDKLGNQSYTVDVTVPEIEVPEIGLPTDIDWNVLRRNLSEWIEKQDWLKVWQDIGTGFETMFEATLAVIDGLFGTELLKMHEKITEYTGKWGVMLNEKINGETISQLDLEAEYEKEHGETPWMVFYKKVTQENADMKEAFNEVFSTPELRELFRDQYADQAAHWFKKEMGDISGQDLYYYLAESPLQDFKRELENGSDWQETFNKYYNTSALKQIFLDKDAYTLAKTGFNGMTSYEDIIKNVGMGKAETGVMTYEEIYADMENTIKEYLRAGKTADEALSQAMTEFYDMGTTGLGKSFVAWYQEQPESMKFDGKVDDWAAEISANSVTANPSTFEKSITTRDLYTLFGNSGAGASPIQIISRIELDGQVLGESVTNYQNDQTQATNGRQ